jgi:outer membrane receptor for ferrienterochelin and colicin
MTLPFGGRFGGGLHHIMKTQTFLLFLFLLNALLGFSQKNTRPLADVLQELQTKKQLNFIYLDKDVSNIFVNNTIDFDQKIELILPKLLKNNDLAFEVLPKNTYRIFKATVKDAPSVTLSGYIRETNSQEALIGATIFCPQNQKSVATNNYGYYFLSLPASKDSVLIVLNYVGFETKKIRLSLEKDTRLDLEMRLQSTDLQEVVIRAERPLSQSPLSVMTIDPKMVKDLPALLGEKDVMKTLQLLPGVQSTNEGSSGLSVRGGGADQNLIILDDMPIYNVSHLFGFFSIFNGDAIKDIQLLKGSFPARYGGRLSSVIDVTMKEGNKEKLQGEGGIGIISSRFTLEGPLKKHKSSFLLSGRGMYQQLLALPFFKLSGLRNPVFNFFDLNMKANFQVTNNDNFYISSYLGRDAYGTTGTLYEGTNVAGRESIDWSNRTLSLRWNHIFSSRIFSNFVVGTTNYAFATRKNQFTNKQLDYDFNTGSKITDGVAKADFTFLATPNNTIKVGTIAQQHFFVPTNIAFFTKKTTDVNGFNGQLTEKKRYNALETAFYIENTYKPTKKIEINTGLRYASYQTKTQTYSAPEPRINLGYAAHEKLHFSASFTRMNQYVHLVSNSGIALPTDLWIPSTDKIKPQRGNQYSLGSSYLFDKQGLTFSAEAYYKTMNNVVGYREGANFLQLDITSTKPTVIDWENLITQGTSKSYGIEFFLQKTTGQLTGWAAYTYAKVQQQFDELNYGRAFAPRQDRRHSLNLVGVYALNKKIKLSATWQFSTGNPVQLPLSVTEIKPHLGTGNQVITEYGARDSYRNPIYHRFDASVQIHKQKRRFSRYWEFGIFNVYNRLNPVSYSLLQQYDPSTDTTKYLLEKLSFFTFVPSVSYNFKF